MSLVLFFEWFCEWQLTSFFLSFCRVARRDMAKRRYEQRQEERVSAIRERTSAMREKEKASLIGRVFLIFHI